MRTAALLLILTLPLSASAQESDVNERPVLSLRPVIGTTHFGGAVCTFGASVLVRASPRLGVMLAGTSWSFDSACPGDVPSTCGDDGWSLMGGARVALMPARSWTPFVEGQVGRYWFSDHARDGDATSSVGFRGGLSWILGSGVELELAAEFQRLSGYEQSGVEYPVIEIKGLQLGVGIPIL